MHHMTPRNGTPETPSAQQLATELLELITQIASDLHLHPAAIQRIQLDSSFDQDLSLDSLTRMELFSRVEKHFAIALPEEILSRLETPRELLREIVGARSRHLQQDSEDINRLVLDETSDTPDTAATLVDVLYWHASQHPERPHMKLTADNESEAVISYGDMLEGAEQIAAGLQRAGLKHRQAVAIMLPTCRDYFFTFLGILIAGGTPVPIYPPARPNQLEDHLLRHSRIMANCQASILVTIPEAKPVARLLKAQAATLHSILTPEELASGNTADLIRPPISADDIAFLQYTSGSTGTPKGVTLTHRNLLANIRAMGNKVQITSRDVFVSWLPLYHDMGLIGAWLGNLYFASLLVIMSPLSFLARPERWLRAIHNNRATLTAAPNFAYELCIKRTDPQLLEEIQLDSLRAVFNGAEPISPTTLERFSEHFAPAGFDPRAMMPVYGLAECSLGLAFPPLGRGPLIDDIDRDTFMLTGKAVAATVPDKALRFVCCGEPLPDHEIRIVDSSGREQPEGQQGRLQFRGPSTTGGYFRNPEATRELFQQEWLNSGDMAYISRGEIYITGRSKDIIIHAGRNIYPHELEEAISRIEGIRKGCVAVFGSANPDQGTEKLVVLAETRESDQERRSQLVQQISSVVSQLARTAPDDVVLAPLHAVLKTSSGKVRRAGCREIYEKGLIGRGTRPVWHQLFRIALASGIPELRNRWHSLRTTLYGCYAWAVFVPVFLASWVLVTCLPCRTIRWSVMRTAGRLLTLMQGIPVRVSGEQNIPRDQPCILLCNHSSYLDGFFLATRLPVRFSFVAKSELGVQFMAGRFLRALDTHFVTRTSKEQSTEDARAITESARQGHSILFFPEGTMTRMPGLLPFQSGAFVTAAETGLPVIPMALRGTRSLLRVGSWLPRRTAVSLHIGEPVQADPGLELDTWAQAVHLREQARAQMLRMTGEPDLSHEQSALRRAVQGSRQRPS